MAIKDSTWAKLSPVDIETSEVANGIGESKTLDIIARGGDPVRATHPGRVQAIVKISQIYVITLAATGGNTTDLSGRTPDDPNVNLAEFPNTTYAGLGSVNVQVGEKVSQGHQLGTVSFFPSSEGPGGTTGITYGVNANGSGTQASRLAPQGELAIGLITDANSSELHGPERPREEPDEAGTDTPGLNEIAATENKLNPPSLDNVGIGNFPYVSKPQVRFVEQKNQVFNHDFLVYISGVDVTPYLVGQLSINIVDKDGWNECHLSLNNALNNFIITQENIGFNNDLKGVFRTGNSQGERKYSEEAKREIIEYKKNIIRNPIVDVATQKFVEVSSSQGVVSDASAIGNQYSQISNATGKTGGVAPVKGEANATKKNRARSTATQAVPGLQDRRWQLGFMSAVFHKHDPIRVFRKNPIRELDEWLPAFTGYLNDISYDTDYTNGKSMVKLSCYDIRALAAKMRIQETGIVGPTNPRAIFQGESAAGSASLFTDLLNPSIVGNPLQAKRYEDVMEFLITGTSSQAVALNVAFGESKFRRGIGDFSLGDRISYRPGNSAASPQIPPDPLEHWQALCLFGTDGRAFSRINDEGTEAGAVVTGKGKEVLGSRFDRRHLTQAEARAIGKATTHDGEWAPHKQFVHFLLPANGTGAKNLLESDVANVQSNQIDFRSRLDIMQDFSARIDYQFWVSPIGDFIVEFPQYDFMPEDYGEYSTVFKVDKHLSTDEIQDEAGDMVTAIIAHGRIRPENEANANVQDFIQPKAVVVSPMMMMRYGVLEHELTLPFISNSKSLARIAQIEFQKKLAESNKMNMSFNYRPWILPNRPIEHMERKRIGITTAVSNTGEVFKAVNTSVTTRYVRRQIFRSNGQAAYTFIFSGTSMPITYREIYKPGTIAPTTGAAGSVTISQRGIGTSSSSNPTDTNTSVKAQNAQNVTAGYAIATPPGSPTPSSEQVGRFMAMAQQSSGWNTLERGADGAFGLFGLPKETRDALGIGDSTDVTTQIEGADRYWRDLASKYNNDFDKVVEEFKLGIEKIKNFSIVEEFRNTFGAVNKALGKEYEKVALALTNDYEKLFPGDKDPTNLISEASTEAKEAIEAAETAVAAPSDDGYQSTVGILVITTSDAAATENTTEGVAQIQATQNVVTNG